MEKIKVEQFWGGVFREPDYACSLCHDCGWVTTEKGVVACSCRYEELLARRRKSARLTPALLKMRFENFRLGYYPEYLKIIEQDKEITIHARAMAQKTLEASQEFVHTLAEGKASRGLIFEGEVGRGKTFLAASIANALVEKGVNLLFLVVPEFLEELRYTYQQDSPDSEEEIMGKAENAPVLILDDLGAHHYSDWSKNKIFTLLNYRLNHHLPCIITTNLSVDEMGQAIGSRSVSRIMEMCDYYFLFSGGDFRHQKREGGGCA